MRLVKLLLLCAFTITSLEAKEPLQKEINITIYNRNFGIVREIREVELQKNLNNVEISNVASSIIPTTVKVKFDGKVGEQSYRNDLANLEVILNKYIDKEIILMSKDGLREYKGTLISSNYMTMVLQDEKGGLLMFPKTDEFLLKAISLPEGLITKPTLVWDLYSNSSGIQDLELSYSTQGLNWHTEYVATLNSNDTKMDLNAWVQIDNNSGATYKNANLKLVAGDLNLVNDNRLYKGVKEFSNMDMIARSSAASAPSFEENPFFEYHIYELSNKTNVLDKESKQISLFESKDVKIEKKYKYISNGYGGESANPQVMIHFKNSKDNKLGMPLPQGKVRLSKSDGKAVEFIGEDNILHKAKDEDIELQVGKAFDLTINEKLISNEQISNTKTEQEVELELNNRKEKDDATITVSRAVWGNWEIKSSSMPFRKKDANTIEFDVQVKAGKSEKLNYVIRLGY